MTMLQRSVPAARRATHRGLVGDAAGSAAVEFALMAVPFFIFLFGIISAGQVMWLQSALNASVAAAARCASINATTCGSQSQIQAYAASEAGAGFDGSIFSAATAACGNQVSASYPMVLMIPFMTLSVTLSAQACYPV